MPTSIPLVRRPSWVRSLAPTALVMVGLSLVQIGNAAQVHFRRGYSPASTALLGTQLRAGSGVHEIPCLNLPISSALISPTSCWQTSPTGLLLAGSNPRSVGAGAVAVIDGQAQSLTVTPGTGPLRVSSASAGGACVEDAGGTFRTVDLATGALSATTATACALTESAASGGGGDFSAQLAAQIPSQTGTALPPAMVPSYYEDYSYYSSVCADGREAGCPLYQQGQSTYTPGSGGLLVLDFGAPCFVPNSSTYGAQMFLGSVCVPDSSLKSLVEDWIAGYESDHGAGTPSLALALGTSNSLNGVDPGYSLSPAQMQTSGQDWYQQLVAAVSSTGLAAPLAIWGASDMEQSSSGNWYSGSPTVAWMTGYSAASPAQYSCSLATSGFVADYGDDILGGSGSADGWTVAQVYEVAWGIPAACALPEVYYPGMASEWEALSQWGLQNTTTGGIIFTGVMTETVSGTYTPTQGWTRLQTDTSQSPPVPCSTEIGTSLQGQPPQVSGVSPASGALGGGTVVTVSGLNLLGTQAVYFGGTAAPSFTIDNADTLSATSPPGSAGLVDVQVETALGTSSAGGQDGFVYSAAGAYHPLLPARIEDTRPGSALPGSGSAPGPGQTLNVQVAGVGGVPSSGVAAVIVNLTVTAPTSDSFVTMFPAGVARPGTSSLDFNAGATKANLVEVALGRGGQVSVYNQLGTTQVVVDVEGWFDTSAAVSGAGLYNPLPPQRIVDTRPGSGEPYAGQTLGAGQSLVVQVAGRGGVPSSGAEAVVLNLTATDPTVGSYLTVFPTGSVPPTASNLNFAAGQTVPNQVVIELGTGGAVTVYNAEGSVDVVVDVAGWFSAAGSSSSPGSDLYAMVPGRAVDTRAGSGEPYAGNTLQPGQTVTFQLGGLAGLPLQGMTAVAINVTVTDTTAPGYLQVWPSSGSQPVTSELNWNAGQTTQNLVITSVGPSGEVSFHNGSTGTAQLVVDADGWFAIP